MGYTLTRNIDPIGANTNLYLENTKNKNVLANSMIQPYQSIFSTEKMISAFGNTRRNNNMNFLCGCSNYMPNMARVANSNLYTIGRGFGGGSFGCNSIFTQGFSMLGNFFGGIGLPFFGSGSSAGGGVANSYSYKGCATASPYGTNVVSNSCGGKSRSINLGGLGSYSSGSGGRALNILGIFSKTRSGGNTAYDFSGVVNLLTGGLF